MQKILVVDWILVFTFILSAGSGIMLHIAGHYCDHGIWHNWAVSHIVTTSLFLIAATSHVRAHWGWYKGFFKSGIGRKSKITLILSFFFLAVLLTGIVLLGVNGANSPIGLWHYKIGIIMSLLSIGHIFKRLPVLRKSIRKK